MAKRRSKTSTTKSQINDTFEDLDVTLNDGLEVVEEIEESQEMEEIVEPAPVKKASISSKGPGIYYNDQLVESVKAQGVDNWVVFVNGKKVVAAPSAFEVIE